MYRSADIYSSDPPPSQGQATSSVSSLIGALVAAGVLGTVVIVDALTEFYRLRSTKLATPPDAWPLFAVVVLGLALTVVAGWAISRVWRPASVQYEVVKGWRSSIIAFWAAVAGYLLLVNYPVPLQAHHKDKFIIVIVLLLLWGGAFIAAPRMLQAWLETRFYAALALILINLAIFAVVAEVTFRLADPVLARSGLFGDKQTPANLRAGVKVRGSIGRTNSQGFRDRERRLERESGAPRVVALGDSVTWGAGVGYDEAFVTLLERALSQWRQGGEVINLGVPAWGPYEEFHLLKQYGIRFLPDVVMLDFFIGNDIQNKRGDDFRLNEIMVVAGNSFYVHANGNVVHDSIGPDRWYLYHDLNYLWRVGMNRLMLARESASNVPTGEDPPVVSESQYLKGIHERSDQYRRTATPFFTEHWARTQKVLQSIAEYLQGQKVGLLVVLIPEHVQLDSILQHHYLERYHLNEAEFDFEKPTQMLKAWLSERHIPYVDLSDALRDNPAGSYIPNDFHPNAEGHARAARAIWPVLKDSLALGG